MKDLGVYRLTSMPARNLKFYPLSLRRAFDKDEALEFLSGSFYAENCQGVRKLFSELSTWELLNLRPSVILDLPDRLYQEQCVIQGFYVSTGNV